MHSMKRKKCVDGIVGIKIDMQKAYDQVDWKVLSHILSCFGFSARVVNLLSQCSSAELFSILLNGSIFGNVQAKRGIRQRDPLSPFLFIIRLELSSRMLHRFEVEGKIQGIKIGRSSPAISHIFFVDDLMIFCRANGENVSHIAECLSQFCKWTRQLISVSKFGCVFSSNTKARVKAQIKHLLNMKELPKDTKYFGNLLFLGKKKYETFSYLFLHLGKKLEGRKAKLLSQAGRCTLVKVVLNSTPIYSMFANKLPFSWSQKIDKMTRKFFWVGRAEKDRFWYPMSWDKICSLKPSGGLRLRRFEGIKVAL